MKEFRQRDITDCGAACLRYFGAHYRHDVPVARLRQLADTNQRGSTALGVRRDGYRQAFVFIKFDEK